MKPILPWEITLSVTYLKSAPIDIQKAISLALAANQLAASPTPFNMTVNQFRQLVFTDGKSHPHPDILELPSGVSSDRGLAMLLDADVVADNDDDFLVSPLVLQAAWADLVYNNEGSFQDGTLALKYPELWVAVGSPTVEKPSPQIHKRTNKHP